VELDHSKSKKIMKKDSKGEISERPSGEGEPTGEIVKKDSASKGQSCKGGEKKKVGINSDPDQKGGRNRGPRKLKRRPRRKDRAEKESTKYGEEVRDSILVEIN